MLQPGKPFTIYNSLLAEDDVHNPGSLNRACFLWASIKLPSGVIRKVKRRAWIGSQIGMHQIGVSKSTLTTLVLLFSLNVDFKILELLFYPVRP